MLPAEHRVRIRSTNLTWREVDDEIIALDLVSSTYFTTNATGTLLWKSMLEGSTFQTLVDILVTSFEIPASVAAQDTSAFLRLLADNGLLDREV
jgi:hypothetical protein